MTPQPWAAIFIDWLHPSAVIFAVLFPLLRALVRRIVGVRPAFVHSNVMQDVANGLIFPTFVALALHPMIPGVMQKVEGHPLQIAGALAILQVLKEILKPDRPTNSSFS